MDRTDNSRYILETFAKDFALLRTRPQFVERPQVLELPVMSPESSNIRFGVFEADLNAVELRKNGRKIKLQGQPFQLLAMLLERPGQVTTREELRARLWPADTFVDFDHGLNAAIKRLRDALGDSAENPRFVETLARRGYRFIAPINAVAVHVPFFEKTITERRFSGGHWRVAVAVLLVLFGTGAGWVAARHFNGDPKVLVAERRLTANPPDEPILNAVISPDAKYLAFASSPPERPTRSRCLQASYRSQPVGFPMEVMCS
jgi:DNA-binding winged helix-turn-helix (wHTH) protein